ncbi:hypothetical protein PC121_g3350 [Phytophthora cactorum]|nr:hypothetical protein PC121_g3350 [Phytophthora cactorum]
MSASLVAFNSARQAFTPKQIAAFFFKPMLDEEGDLTGYHVCKACGKRRKHAPNNGYTSLVTHVRTAHPSFEHDMRDATTAATGTLIAWVSQNASNHYGWLKWIIMGNLPLLLRIAGDTPVYSLHSNMEGVTKVVEITIGKEMPVNSGLILDDCSFGTEQYQGVYGCYETPSGPQYPLLSMAPVMDEPGDHLTAEGHPMAIERFQPFFGKTIQGVKFLVGDNCAVNKRLAKLMKIPLVGCASHRLNLAVRDFLRPHESALKEVQQAAHTEPSGETESQDPSGPSPPPRYALVFDVLDA